MGEGGQSISSKTRAQKTTGNRGGKGKANDSWLCLDGATAWVRLELKMYHYIFFISSLSSDYILTCTFMYYYFKIEASPLISSTL